jgi:plastocyanin
VRQRVVASSTPRPTATVTITGGVAAPQAITIARGGQVTFVNNDSKSHLMFSDPHPDHTDCPEINSVGALTPGQTRQTGNLNIVRTCGFHDHDDSTNRNLRGTITIQ